MQADLSFNGSLDPDEWYRWAREWREAGRFEDALRAHEWYHAHVLDLNEAACGVRLSYALTEWLRLARKYEPAQESLSRIRSQAEAAALGKQPDRDRSFHDALSIDWVLNDEPAAYDLIGRVEATHGEALGEYYNNHVFRVLFDRREYARCLRWMGNPADELDIAVEFLDFQRSSDMARIRERAAGRFVDRTIELAVVLLGAGDTTGADEIVRKANRHVDDPRVLGLDEARRILQERPPR